MMKFLTPFIATLLLSVSFHNYAEESNELTIKSLNQDMNYKANTMYFSGKVLVNQGNVTITAEELFVETSAEGDSERLVAKGKPAVFSQLNVEGEDIEAHASEITYNVELQTLELKGEAKFQQGGSLVTSKNILFDLKQQRVKAEGGSGENERVVTRLKTKSNTQQ